MRPVQIRSGGAMAAGTMPERRKACFSATTPAGGDGACSPVYEEMREAYEDWLLLSLLREKGLEKELKSLLGEFAASFDKAKMETSRPYRCDFASLRLKALEYAARQP